MPNNPQCTPTASTTLKPVSKAKFRSRSPSNANYHIKAIACTYSFPSIILCFPTLHSATSRPQLLRTWSKHPAVPPATPLVHKRARSPLPGHSTPPVIDAHVVSRWRIVSV